MSRKQVTEQKYSSARMRIVRTRQKARYQMQLVIDIDENEYKRIIRHYESFPRDLSHYERKIVNGTPLPKGHGDLIDVNRKITVSTYDEQYEEWGEQILTVLEALNKWSDEGVTVKDVIIPADTEGENECHD